MLHHLQQNISQSRCSECVRVCIKLPGVKTIVYYLLVLLLMIWREREKKHTKIGQIVNVHSFTQCHLIPRYHVSIKYHERQIDGAMFINCKFKLNGNLSITSMLIVDRCVMIFFFLPTLNFNYCGNIHFHMFRCFFMLRACLRSYTRAHAPVVTTMTTTIMMTMTMMMTTRMMTAATTTTTTENVVILHWSRGVPDGKTSFTPFVYKWINRKPMVHSHFYYRSKVVQHQHMWIYMFVEVPTITKILCYIPSMWCDLFFLAPAMGT